jgi:hypothetical protein
MPQGREIVLFLVGLVMIGGLYYGVNITGNEQEKQSNNTKAAETPESLKAKKTELSDAGQTPRPTVPVHSDAPKTYQEVFKETPPQKSETERMTERETVRKLDKSTEEIIQKADERIQDRHLIVPNNPVLPEKTQELNKKIELFQKNLDQQQ